MIRPAGRKAGTAPLLTVTGLRKSFGATEAVAGVDLTVAAGEIIGLLGANGAGKTTTVECIAGLTTPDAGTIAVAGNAAIGLALQATGLPGKLTARETLRLFASLHAAPDTSADLIARFGLAARADARCETLSQGTSARAGLALAMIGDPLLLVLDEPTAGLDPLARREFHDLLRTLRADGRGILITTHDMAEAETLCDRVAILAAGRIVAEGAPAALVAGRGLTLRVRTDRPLGAASLASIAGEAEARQQGCEVVFSGAEPRALVQRLAGALIADGIALVGLESTGASLDDLIIGIARQAHG